MNIVIKGQQGEHRNKRKNKNSKLSERFKNQISKSNKEATIDTPNT